jgi:hypothetical protein
MSVNRYAIALAGMLVVTGTASHALAQRSSRTAAAADKDVQQLIRLMDADMNGTVSKDEFMNYMSQTFDRLDVNRNRQLEPNELRPFSAPYWYRRQRDPHNDR